MRHFSLILVLFFFLKITGCVNPSSGPPPDDNPPTIQLYEPANNDTIYIGQLEISYDASDDQGIRYHELYVNGIFQEKYETNADGSKPAIIWAVDPDFLNSLINYYIITYDASNNTTRSEIKKNILVLKKNYPPDAPQSLQLNRLSTTTVNLRWEDVSSNEDGFEIWRKPESGSYKKIQTLPFNSIAANDTGLIDNIVYYYKVRSFNEFGNAESNEVASGANPANNAPLAPSDLNGQPLATDRIKLLWTDNSDNELGFKIERKNSSAQVYSHIGSVGPDISEFVDNNGLFATTSYTYRVSAMGQYGSSGFSNEATVVTFIQNINPPNNLNAVYNSDSLRVELNWSDNSYLEIETRIERKSGITGTYSEIGKTTTDISKYADSSVHTGAIYYYRVRIYTEDGYYSEYSNEAIATTQ